MSSSSTITYAPAASSTSNLSASGSAAPTPVPVITQPRLRSQPEFYLTGVRPLFTPPGDDCPICTEPLATDIVQILACAHVYHTTCILTWLSGDGGVMNRRCPMCRVELFEAAPRAAVGSVPETGLPMMGNAAVGVRGKWVTPGRVPEGTYLDGGEDSWYGGTGIIRFDSGPDALRLRSRPFHGGPGGMRARIRGQHLHDEAQDEWFVESEDYEYEASDVSGDDFEDDDNDDSDYFGEDSGDDSAVGHRSEAMSPGALRAFTCPPYGPAGHFADDAAEEEQPIEQSDEDSELSYFSDNTSGVNEPHQCQNNAQVEEEDEEMDWNSDFEDTPNAPSHRVGISPARAGSATSTSISPVPCLQSHTHPTPEVPQFSHPLHLERDEAARAAHLRGLYTSTTGQECEYEDEML